MALAAAELRQRGLEPRLPGPIKHRADGVAIDISLLTTFLHEFSTVDKSVSIAKTRL
jgi:hypothetical protein